MHKVLIITIIFISSVICNGFGQSISLHGQVKDEVSSSGVSDAVAMAVRLSDSVLIRFSRSDSSGFFRLQNLPVDTYQVVFSHPKFGDKTFIIMGNPKDSIMDLKKILLPMKSKQIAEVTIYGFSSPVYFNGDTLVYAADSFKVKPNAMVEDLLKKLPGVKVDQNGKIFSNGEQVDKVLVDGDEFFGTDPTLATKNLPANSVESVQVFDKKSDNTSEESKEMEKVMNLKLKENAKKGYFGKVSAAGDFDRFFEEQLLFNRFRGKQKLSVFSLGSNTLNSQINWEDIHEYGLYGEYGFDFSEDGDMSYQSMNNNSSGIPRTFKNGVYFSDRIFGKTDISIDYTNTISDLETKRELYSKYLFSDTTYETRKNSLEEKYSESNSVNLKINQKLDSLTTFTLNSKLKYDIGKRTFAEENQFISEDDKIVRATETDNITNIKRYDIKNNMWLKRDFKKRNRELSLNYRYNINNSATSGFVRSSEFNDTLAIAGETDQQKSSATDNIEHVASVSYTEPLAPKFKVEVALDHTSGKGRQEKRTQDFFNGSYEQLNDSLTNNFESSRQTDRAGLKLVYETKKRTFTVGVRVRQIDAKNRNLETQEQFSQTVNNILPHAKFRYTLSDNARLTISYLTSSRQPDLNQLQPINDNSDPNSSYIGNPDLLPSYHHTLNVNYNFFKAVKGNSMWSTLRITSINNNISNSVSYDSVGKRIIQPVNIDGNYRGNLNLSYSRPFFNKRLEIGPDINSSFSNSSNVINGETNNTQNLALNGGVYIMIHPDSGNTEIVLEGKYGNTFSKTAISSFTGNNFLTGFYRASVSYEITKKWTVTSDISYNSKTQQANGRNVEYYKWGATLSKKFLKQDALVISVEAFDLLNQNIEAEQTFEDNVLTYSESNTVGRYILLKATYRFTGGKKSDNDE